MNVLLSLSPPDGTTKYVVQLTQGMPDEVKLQYFSWKTAILGKYDLFHVHWPEFLVRSNSHYKHLVKMVLCSCFLVALFVRRTPVVRTVHNLAPHENGGRYEAMLMRCIDKLTVVYIRLNPHTPTPKNSKSFTILHGHYVDWFSEIHRPLPERGRILNFGLLRPYKGVEALIDIIRSHRDLELNLRVVGKPIGPEIGARIEARSAHSDRISLRLEFVQDAELVAEIGRSELVVLPYSEMHNSGAALLALSLSRPVLVPRNVVTESLRTEVGRRWVHFFDTNVLESDIEAALSATRTASASESPKLGGRDWENVGRQHQAAYETALRKRPSLK